MRAQLGSHRSYPISQSRKLRCKEVEDLPKGTHWREMLLPTMLGPQAANRGFSGGEGAQQAAAAPEEGSGENLFITVPLALPTLIAPHTLTRGLR